MLLQRPLLAVARGMGFFQHHSRRCVALSSPGCCGLSLSVRGVRVRYV
ncbi:hypothetical protein M3J09_007023 [Ascochyta lentis]